ncbi:NAD(P)/FAD-dependent oxidoreductase [Chitinophagaceae bacterium MMS25-I14]
MTAVNTYYDAIIIGGGLAGLALGIQLRKAGKEVLVIEKDDYPRHKVCGEYISMESKPFLERLGLPVMDMDLPVINNLQVTDVKGRALDTVLKPGGFGISRYRLDATLAGIFRAAGGTLFTKTKAEEVSFCDDVFTVRTAQKVYSAKVVAGSWGKRSSMDIKYQRPFIIEQKKGLDNYIGVKYHIEYPVVSGRISLHNFEDGYCGISAIEDGKACLCYLTKAAVLQKYGNDIKQMEQEVLMQNPHLKKIFTEATFLWPRPEVISQISFHKKEQVYDHILLTGDAAGLITPLCGNGMSMAFHASKLAFGVIEQFLSGAVSRKLMEQEYIKMWKQQFATRLSAGRLLQANFGKSTTTTLLLQSLKLFPFLKQPLIRATFGREF